jgi:peptidoglycan/xylan/chitin deacetylase (PgdA/CDA1 family)
MNTSFDILLYHGVHEDALALEGRNSSGKHIGASQFADQMKHLSATRNLVSVPQIAAAYQGRYTLPENAVAVTFDDGYLNNYLVAWPILEKYGVPATFYLATGFIGTDRMIWTDRLEHAILNTQTHSIKLLENGVEATYKTHTEEDRIKAFTTIKTLCKTLPDGERLRVLASVFRECNSDAEDTEHPLYAFMNWDQVRKMFSSPLIDFGGHTIDHVSLTKVPKNEMQRQIKSSIETVSQELDEKIDLFSYPEGQEKDYDDTVIDTLKSLGIDHCPTAIAGGNDLKTTSPYELKRVMVGFENRPYPF